MRVLSRLAGWMLGAALTIGCDAAAPAAGLPAIGRPEGASQGPRAAVIVALRGDVSVEPSSLAGGTSFPAHPELQLLRDDRLVVGPQSFVLVALHNGHIVRLNEGSRLRVDAMASFDDPPAGTDIEQRFADALSPAERDDVELRGAITRVAGWNTRMNAAQTIAPQPAQSPPPLAQDVSVQGQITTEEPRDAKAAGQATLPGASHRGPQPTGAAGLGNGGGAELPDQPKVDAPPKNIKPTPPAPPQDDAPSPEPEADKKELDQDSEESKDKEPSKSPDTKKSKSPSTALDLPDTVDHRDLADKHTNVGLPGPLRTVRFELAKCAGAGAKISAQVRDKKLVALTINGVASTCVPALIGKTVAQPNGWIEMTVQP